MPSLNSSGVPRASAPGEALTPPSIPQFDAGVCGPDDAVRALAAELEKILAQKPSHRPAPIDQNRRDPKEPGYDPSDEAHRSLARALEAAASRNYEAGFEWHNTIAGDTGSQPDDTGAAASMLWVAKARRDKRRRRMRNVLGWIATLVIGASIVGGAAYALTGWLPDVAGLLAFGQKMLN